MILELLSFKHALALTRLDSAPLVLLTAVTVLGVSDIKIRHQALIRLLGAATYEGGAKVTRISLRWRDGAEPLCWTRCPFGSAYLSQCA